MLHANIDFWDDNDMKESACMVALVNIPGFQDENRNSTDTHAPWSPWKSKKSCNALRRFLQFYFFVNFDFSKHDSKRRFFVLWSVFYRLEAVLLRTGGSR